MSNLLAQSRELSLLAMGVGLHIQSLPEGARVSIRVLAERFPETEYRIGRALGELEAAGFLRRTRLRMPGGSIVTRTVSYNLPLSETPPDPEPDPDRGPDQNQAPDQDPESDPDQDPQPPSPAPEPPSPAPEPEPAPEQVTGAEPPGDPVRDPRPARPVLRVASELLAGLRIREPRLLLAERDVERLVPGVVEWLERGAAYEAVRRALTADVPSDLRNPAGLLAYRLRAAIPPPLPERDRGSASTPPPDRVIHPFRTCDGCERAFRSPTPATHCGDCTAHGRKAA
ncbi:helix-turn-helix domain-containing protein [Streptomyces sp. NPDC086989]|uniref:helix-turn-helix domain-containing protein n=1 Tax=Streptomyces sp. NPDC086989 TaxID=3365764 RepID=UPI00382B3D2F